VSTRRNIDAREFQKLFLAGANRINAQKEYINELNVFPVPDGDTGTNMTLTIKSAVKEVSALGETDSMKDICKAIQTSDLGINPQNDGRVVRLVFPQLTEDRRKDLVKQVKKYAEDAKVAMRNIRRDGMDYVKKLKKNSEITEDDQKKAEKDLQDLLDKNIKKVDAALAAKEKELMAI
jgi:ribosome recycling factor